MNTTNMASGEGKMLSSLNAEFEKWNEDAVEGNIFLLEAYEKEDGTASILFSLAGEYEFVLHCPKSYPQNDGTFLAEATGSLQVWAKSLNDYVLESGYQLRLHDVLNKAMVLYCQIRTQKDSISISSEDDTLEEEEESEMGVSLTDDEAFTTEWELKIARIKKQWLTKENEIREKMKKAPPTTATNEHPLPIDKLTGDKNQAKQIFSTSASSGVLTNDLIAIMESQKDLGIKADPIDDNIYNWVVKLSGFEGALDEDLKVINKRFGYNYIELHLEFTMDMYPFYPPLVKVVRPRLQPAMMQRVTNMELLKLSYWNPARDMMSILYDIKKFLQQWARLDIETRRNNMPANPQGAYLEIEHDLLRLAMVSEICPRANAKFVLECTTAQLPFPNFIQNKGADSKVYWAPGTGYGSGYARRQGWDVNAYQAAQKLKDQQIVTVLQKILCELQRFPLSESGRPFSNGNSLTSYSDSETPMEGIEYSSEHTNNSDSAICTSVDLSHSSTSSLEPFSFCEEELFEIVEASALIPFIESHLRASSFLEICRHSMLYHAIIDVIKEMARQSRLVGLLASLPDQEKSIADYLFALKEQASLLLTRICKVAANGSIPQLQPAQDFVIQDPSLAEEKVAREFSTLHDIVLSALQQHCKEPVPSSSSSSDLGTIPTQVPDEVQYQRCLKPFQFQNHAFETAGTFAHLFSRAYAKANAPSSHQVFRIAQELSSLSSSLPLTMSSSIFVRADDDKCTLLRVMITGPEETPYTGGCFLFDIYFPEGYPSVPPQVQLRTTGKGTVRFNPNLYSCGKVCLSLLGTWEGQQGERWNSETSTILQVLVSIQSLILVPEPYFNEPGYETKIGTDQGKKLSATYNEEVRVNNIKWAIIDQLQNPCPGFEEVIRLHFFIQKKKILQEMNTWLQGSKSSKLRSAIDHLEKELCQLQSNSELQELVQSYDDEAAVKL